MKNVRKSGKIGKILDGYKVLDSKCFDGNTRYLLECQTCKSVFWKSKTKWRCHVCSGGNMSHNARGYGKDPLHAEYTSIRRRIRGHEAYKGVYMCEEWEKDFTKFREWAIKAGWRKGLTIDRIDNAKGYEPSNCRWATMKQQANNKRTNVRLEYNGETRTLSEWADYMGFPYTTILGRWHNGWSIEDILCTPYGSRKKYSEMTA